MNKASLLLTASRFGARYWLDIFSQMRPQDAILDDAWRPTEESLKEIAQFLEITEEAALSIISKDPAELWRQIVAATDRSDRFCIAKVYYYHLPGTSDMWGAAAKSGRVIHLLRRNLFDSYLSRELAQKLGHWQTLYSRGTASLADLRVTLDPVAAKKHIDARLRDIDWARERFDKHDYHEIAFEDIARAPGACAKTIKAIFGEQADSMPHPAMIRPRIANLKRRSNADIVENYMDVVHLDRNWL